MTARSHQRDCPAWCRLAPRHPWDSTPDEGDTLVRLHDGPTFGQFSTSGTEYTDGRPAEYVAVLGNVESVAEVEYRACDLRELARDAERAAEWMQAAGGSIERAGARS